MSGSYSLLTTGVDTNYVRTGFKTVMGQEAVITLQSPTPANSTDGFWVHCRKYQNDMHGAGTGIYPIILYNEADQPVAALYTSVGYGWVSARVWANDGTYSASGESSAFYTNDVVDNVTLTFDLHVYTTGDGKARFDAYVDGTLRLTITDESSYQRGMSYAKFGAVHADPAKYCVYSEFLVANFDTRGLRVGTYIPSADGTYTDGEGTYADIDETNPDGAAIILAEVGDKQSYTVSKYGSPGLAGILAIAVNGLVASDGTNDLQAGLRIGGVDYFSADLGVGVSALRTCVVWNTNPADGKHLPQNPATDIEVIYQAVA